MEVNYNKLRNLYRLEKKSATRLSHVEADFYSQLSKYILAEKDAVSRAWAEQDIQRLVLFANLVKLVQDIVTIRQRKIVLLALSGAFDENWEPEHLVGWERDLYDEIVETIRKYRERALSEIGLAEGTHVEQVPESIEEPSPEPSEKRLKTVRVKILRAIPEFIGPDFKRYGPFTVGEIVYLPSDVADILLVRDMAEVVSDAEDSDAQV